MAWGKICKGNVQGRRKPRAENGRSPSQDMHTESRRALGSGAQTRGIWQMWGRNAEPFKVVWSGAHDPFSPLGASLEDRTQVARTDPLSRPPPASSVGHSEEEGPWG